MTFRCPVEFSDQLDYLDRNPSIDIAGCCVEIFSEPGIQGGLEALSKLAEFGA